MHCEAAVVQLGDGVRACSCFDPTEDVRVGAARARARARHGYGLLRLRSMAGSRAREEGERGQRRRYAHPVAEEERIGDGEDEVIDVQGG